MKARLTEGEWISLPAAKAIDFLKKKLAMTREKFDLLEDWAKGRAFTIAYVQKINVLQSSLEELREIVRSGGTLTDFQKSLDSIFEASGLDPLSDWHLETVFRTNVQSAYGRGRYEQGQDPEIRDEIFGWIYHAVDDDRVRDDHFDLDGHIFAKGDGEQYWPPWDFNCRCSSDWITREEAEAEGIAPSAGVSASVQDAWLHSNFVSPAIGANDPLEYRPDFTGVHPKMIEDYNQEKRKRGF